jgi:hypothetical protein
MYTIDRSLKDNLKLFLSTKKQMSVKTMNCAHYFDRLVMFSWLENKEQEEREGEGKEEREGTGAGKVEKKGGKRGGRETAPNGPALSWRSRP